MTQFVCGLESASESSHESDERRDATQIACALDIVKIDIGVNAADTHP